jgi:ATP-dependent protease ClpP protease subunit
MFEKPSKKEVPFQLDAVNILTVSTDCHTLVIYNRSKSVDGKKVFGRLSIGEFNSISSLAKDEKTQQEKFNALITALELHSAEIEYLTVSINSPGGSINEGFALLDVIKNNYHGKWRAELGSYAYSMAAVLFLSCPVRIINPLSELMLHDWANTVRGKGGSHFDSFNSNVKRIDQYMYEVTVLQNLISEGQYMTIMNGKDMYFTTRQMCQIEGFCFSVKHEGQYIDPKLYLEIIGGEKSSPARF